MRDARSDGLEEGQVVGIVDADLEEAERQFDVGQTVAGLVPEERDSLCEMIAGARAGKATMSACRAAAVSIRSPMPAIMIGGGVWTGAGM
jgi:hypothetical protein